MAPSVAPKPAGFDELEAAFVANPEGNAVAYGLVLLRAGRAKDAVVALQKLHAVTPLKGQARLTLARALFDVFRVGEAKALLDDVPQAWSNDAIAQRLLAEIALEYDDRNKAKEAIRRSYALDPRDPRTREVMVFLGEIHPTDLTSEAMTDEATIRDAEDDGEVPAARPDILRRTLRWAFVLALALGTIVALYAWRVRVQNDISRIIASGKPLKEKGDWRSLEKADKIYKEAIALDGHHPGALAALTEIHALLYFEHGIDAAKAELPIWLERVRESGSRSGERYLGEGLGIVIAGAPERAATFLTQTVEKGGVDARVLFALGIAERASGRYEAARDALRRAHELDPFQPTFAVELGDTFLIDSDVKSAEYYWHKAAEANPEHTRAVSRALIGRLLLGDDPHTLAIDEALKHEVPPAHRGAFAALAAEQLRALGKNTEALKVMREAKALRPYDAVLDWLLARMLMESASKEGLTALDALCKRYTGLTHVPIEAALYAAQIGKAEEGEARLQALKNLPAPRFDGLRAFIQWRAGDMTTAQARAENALKGDPNVAEAHYVLGRLMQSKKDYPKALAHYTKALQAKAMYPEVYEQVGVIYLDSKEYDQAIATFAQAEKQYAQSAAPFATLARVYDESARAFEARGGPGAKQNADAFRAKIKR